MKFAAIDIGSNAVRLLLTRVIEDGNPPVFKKEALVRIPLRLGDEAFTQKRLSDMKAERLIQTMSGFKHLMEAYQAVDYWACATSAMREAQNGAEIVKAIKERSGINIEIVAGKKEAQIIFANRFEEKLDKKKSYLYIDVGGGSTELTLFTKQKSVATRSFNIGTVRLLQNIVPEERWHQMKKWLKETTTNYKSISGIGSGGNINKIFRLSLKKEGKPLSLNRLKKTYKFLDSYSLEQRIKSLGLRPDRADVIIPASRIYISVMKWAKVQQIYVPQIGLADGLVHILYENHKNKKIKS